MKRDAGKVVAALTKRYPAPAWALFEQVPPGTGARSHRYADAVAMSLWPSRGLLIYGFEIKVYRSDWLRELKNPQKVEQGVFPFCHHWYVVTTKGVVGEADEIPPTWGWLQLDGRGLVEQRKAPRLEAKLPTMGFVAALLRRASERMTPTAAVQDLIDAEREKAQGLVEERARREAGQIPKRYEALKKGVADFEERSGFKITDRFGSGGLRYDIEKIADALEFVRGNGAESDLVRFRRKLRSVYEGLVEATKELGP